MAFTAFKYSFGDDLKLGEGTSLDDEQVFEHVFKTYYRKLTFFANRFLNDLTVAEEIVSDAFTYLWENRNRLAITTSINAYLHKIVQNRCLNYLKHKKIENEYVDYLLKNNLLDHAEALDSVHEKELELQIKKAINELPDRCREIFKMSRFDRLKNKEIAAKLNITTKAVERQMTLALSKLRLCLQHMLIFLTIFLFS